MRLSARQGWRFATALAVASFVGSSAARADDGVGNFFQQLFGGGARSVEQPMPQPEGVERASPPLTVRMHKHRRPTGAQARSGVKYSPEELKGITIYTDRTLVNGDAVMTAQGVRIFHGSSAMPHTSEDFVALSSTSKMAKNVRTELTAIDNAARSDFRSQ